MCGILVGVALLMLFYKVFYSMMNSKIYSVEELQTLLEGTQEEI